MAERSPAYKQKLQNKESFLLFLFTCQSATEYNPGDKSIARKLSEAHPNATIIGFDGYVQYGELNGKPSVTGVSSMLGDNYNDNKGQIVIYQNGKEITRGLYSDYFNSTKQ